MNYEGSLTGTVETLDEAKARRLGGKTMLMPSPAQLARALQEIPRGSTKTLKQMRVELAKSAHTDITCPVALKKCWIAVSQAEMGDAPWWRLTLEGKANPRLAGGAARHAQLLQAEGVDLKC